MLPPAPDPIVPAESPFLPIGATSDEGIILSLIRRLPTSRVIVPAAPLPDVSVKMLESFVKPLWIILSTLSRVSAGAVIVTLPA